MRDNFSIYYYFYMLSGLDCTLKSMIVAVSVLKKGAINDRENMTNNEDARVYQKGKKESSRI